MEEEIWKDIQGFEGEYQISNLGRIKRTTVTISNGALSNGYYIVNLWKDGKMAKVKLMHDLVAQTFIKKLDSKEIVHHINQNKLDNRLQNLSILSSKEHTAIHKKGRIQKPQSIAKGKATRAKHGSYIISQQTKIKMSEARKKAWKEGKYNNKQRDSITGRFVGEVKDE